MKAEIRITKKKVLYLTVCIALIAMLGFVFAVRPNPGHSWSEIGDLPGTIWHSNNDGHGSGLDADTVDSYHAGMMVYISACGGGFTTTSTCTADTECCWGWSGTDNPRCLGYYDCNGKCQYGNEAVTCKYSNKYIGRLLT